MGVGPIHFTWPTPGNMWSLCWSTPDPARKTHIPSEVPCKRCQNALDRLGMLPPKDAATQEAPNPKPSSGDTPSAEAGSLGNTDEKGNTDD